MTKVSLDIESFKALASETRLDILRTLDGKKMSLNDITKVTNLHKMTLYEHLSKLTDAGFITRIEREGHKWVFYKLSWKGQSLLHPENTKIVIMFSMTFISFFLGIFSYINYVGYQKSETPILQHTLSSEPTSPELLFLYTTIICILSFSIFFIISLWKYKKNKPQKL